MKEAWNKIREDAKPYLATIEQRRVIAEQVDKREGPFKTKLKINTNGAMENKNEDEKVVDISKKKVVSGEVASRFVRGADLKTVNLTDMYAALWQNQ